MPAPQSVLCNLLSIIGIGAMGLLVCAGLLPPLEEGRGEVRAVHTWHTARHLSESVPPTTTEVELTDVDPYGNPYRAVPLLDGGVRVLSKGPNGTSPDADDITSDMQESPGRPYQQKRNRQFLIAFGACGLFWLLGAGMWLQRRPRQ